MHDTFVLTQVSDLYILLLYPMRPPSCTFKRQGIVDDIFLANVAYQFWASGQRRCVNALGRLLWPVDGLHWKQLSSHHNKRKGLLFKSAVVDLFKMKSDSSLQWRSQSCLKVAWGF